MFCVRQSSVRGCRFSFVFVYFIFKMCEMFAGSRLLLPVSTNFVTLVPETREEGGTRCQRALAAEGDRGAEEIGSRK